MDELIKLIISQLGVNHKQAEGGAGLLFKMAKEKLGDADFGEIAKAVGGVDDLVKAAPEAGGVSGLLGGLADKFGADGLGDLAELAGGFKSLDLDSDMIGKFVPVVLEFIQNKGGESATVLLKKVFAD